MKKINLALARIVAAFSVVAVALFGVTYATLNTQASLTGSSLSTTSSELKVWDGNDFADTAPGFTVSNIVPGVGSAEYPVSFKNTGGVSLGVGAHVPTALKFSGFNSTTATTAMKYVKVTIKNLSTGDKIDTNLYTLTLSSDVALPGPAMHGAATGNPQQPNTEGNYSMKFDIDPTGIGTAKASVDPFDITFTGRQVASTV